MGSLMGDWTCKPVKEDGPLAVYQKADIEALKERNRSLRAHWAACVRENALLHALLSRYEREERAC